MGCTLVLVRHGRTVYNDQHRLQGWCDSPLTDDGLRGVRATAAALAPVVFDAAYSSPLPRTVTTSGALLAGRSAVPFHTMEGLKEFHFGEYEARPEPELYGLQPSHELFGAVTAGTHPGLPGGESGAQYTERVAAAFTEIARTHARGGTVLVVSHGVTLVTYLIDLIGRERMRPLANASVSVVHVDAAVRRLAAYGIDVAAGEPFDAAVLDPDAVPVFG